MNSLMVSLNAVLPFVLYMSFGYGVRRCGIASMEFLRKLNALVFTAFFPLMMFDNIYSMSSETVISPSFMLFSILSVIVVILLSTLIIARLVRDRQKVPVLIQGIYRSNILLFAIPITRTMFGDGPVALATALVVLIVPIYNLSAVVLLEYFSGRERSSLLELLRNIVMNPLVLGVLVGLAFRALGIRVPYTAMKVVRQYSDMTTPLALFILGGTLEFGAMRRNMRYLIGILVTKLMVVPAIMLLLGWALGFDAMERFVVFTLYATPVATATFPMAQAMGADAELAGEEVVLSTTLSVVTLFFWITLMQNMGMF